jgi:hypothetical protein
MHDLPPVVSCTHKSLHAVSKQEKGEIKFVMNLHQIFIESSFLLESWRNASV